MDGRTAGARTAGARPRESSAFTAATWRLNVPACAPAAAVNWPCRAGRWRWRRIGSASLQYLDCRNTSVSDLTPLAGAASLQNLFITGIKADLNPPPPSQEPDHSWRVAPAPQKPLPRIKSYPHPDRPTNIPTMSPTAPPPFPQNRTGPQNCTGPQNRAGPTSSPSPPRTHLLSRLFHLFHLFRLFHPFHSHPHEKWNTPPAGPARAIPPPLRARLPRRLPGSGQDLHEERHRILGLSRRTGYAFGHRSLPPLADYIRARRQPAWRASSTATGFAPITRGFPGSLFWRAISSLG